MIPDSASPRKQFYVSVAPLVRKLCRLPHLLLCDVAPDGLCFLLGDLSVDFPLHPESLGPLEAQAALSWLAKFHAKFWEMDAAGQPFPYRAQS